MLQLLRDSLATLQLQARYRRLIHERLVQFTEAGGPEPVADDPGRWHLIGGGQTTLPDSERQDSRAKARQLVVRNPHARNILRLLEAYVTGPGLKLTVQQRIAETDARGPELVRVCQDLWDSFVSASQCHYSFSEHARRTWRDGEMFLRKFETDAWPPQVRFIDPERIGATTHQPDSHGIITDSSDVETPLAYLQIDPIGGSLVDEIPAADVLHSRIGVDSNQKRGVTLFAPILHTLDCFDKWVETELTARKLQSSIVLWRKVQGSPQQASGIADGASGGDTSRGRRERIQPGTILTTNHGTDIQFLQPNTNFGDAVPLGRMLLLNVAAGVGLPEFMLTSDASNANFASTMVAEGPAVKLFQAEQQFFSREFTRLWRWIMTEAVRIGELPEDVFDVVQPSWTFPQLINRDRPRERMADVRLVETGVLSRAEVARRDGVDPEQMKAELGNEPPLPKPAPSEHDA